MNPKDSEQLSRYLDGELTPREMRAVEELLATSIEAREEYTAMKQIHETIRETLPQTQFARPHVALRRKPPLFRLAAAAVIAVMFGGMVFGAVKVYEALTTETTEPMAIKDPEPAPHEPAVPGVFAEGTAQSAPETLLPTDEEADVAAVASLEELGAPPLTGVVTDVSGNPISGAHVRALAWLGRHPYELDETPLKAATRTDGSGRFAMDWPAAAKYVEIQARGYQDRLVNYQAPLIAPRIDLHAKLAPATTLSGRVVDTAGNPIPDVRIAESGATDPVRDAVITDADGSFTIHSLRYRGDLFFSHPDYALTALPASMIADPLGVPLEPGASLRLRVLQGGHPVPGALIDVLSEIPEALGYATRRETDEDGCVVFEQVPTHPEALEQFAVVVTAPNGVRAPLQEVPDLRAGVLTEKTLNLPADYPGKVTGSVVDTEGEPIADAPVVIEGSGTPYFRTTRTGPDGRYAADLPFGQNRVFLARGLLVPGQFPQEPSGGRFEVNTPGTVHTQDFTIAAHPEKQITFVYSDGSPVDAVWLYMIPGMPLEYHAPPPKWHVQTAAGRVAFLFESGSGRVFDKKTGYMAQFEIPKDQSEITVVLDEPAGAIAGRVVDPNGDPLSSVEIAALPFDRFRRGLVRTSDDGHFLVEALDLDTAYNLHFTLAGYQVLPGSSINGVRAEREPSLREYVMAPEDAGIFGLVTAEDGEPVAGAMLVLIDEDRWVKQSNSDGDGAFHLDAAPGRYVLNAFAPDLSASASFAVAAPAHGVVVTLPMPAAPTPKPVSHAPAPRSPELASAENRFKQMGIVFRMYANESRGEVFPALEPQDGVFLPEWKEIYPEYLTDTRVLFQEDGITRCYFAHALTNEAQGLAFLDAIEQLGIETVRDQDILVGAGRGTAGGDTILRLNENLGRQLFPDVPAGERVVQQRIPVLWEIPGDREESGGLVLYMDGHVTWQPYPGPFPMTEAFVTRLRGVMGMEP